ncbi:hypothetical protein [Nonomuraea roseoviolacea]|uniref:Uncharacterized protein n=1 Tax=Nonomuraea roseoviolacea subsp. carminata TaxID=160689 RepID=A0ABT1JS20_9ACTN|nr:hypothetical protein [Nonomuraea roseoviolacea]MCP2344546.1 hypothetical protein [Nonomuraea roseoviolacea subsp. carminata]
MHLSTLAAACLIATTAATCAAPPPTLPSASKTDPAGLVMGTKNDRVLMIGILNRFQAYERSATPAQIRACTKRPDMRYPQCLPPTR